VRLPCAFVIAFILPLPALAQARVDSLSRAYSQACYTGIAQAQKVLPILPDQVGTQKRGYASGDGSLQRMLRTGQLQTEPKMGELGCGYAVGAMFAKYGFPDEAAPPSKRLIAAATNCRDLVRKQGIE